MHKIVAVCLLLSYFQGIGQELLSLENAIGIALDQNYGIKLSAMEHKASEMEVYKSNVGMGPTVDLNASFNSSANYTNQRFLDGRTVDRFGRSFTPGTNVSLSLTLFDGGRMQASFDRLGLLSEFSLIQSKVIIQNTIVDVMRSYFDIVREKKTIDYLNTVIRYYTERLKITEERWNVGRGSKLDFLQSQTDLNTQLADLARAQNNYRNAKVNLNGLLVREPSQDFTIQELLPIGDYSYNDLLDKAKNQNAEILLLNKAIEISQKTEQEMEALRKPIVNLNSSFGYNYNNSNAGFILSNQTAALNAGVSARWNLFDGNHRKNQIAIAKLNTDMAKLNRESLEYQISADLTAAYNRFTSNKEILKLEEEIIMIAEENLSISLEKFRLGGSTILELNEAQRSYDAALNRLVNAEDNVKVSEMELLLLSGVLVE